MEIGLLKKREAEANKSLSNSCSPTASQAWRYFLHFCSTLTLKIGAQWYEGLYISLDQEAP